MALTKKETDVLKIVVKKELQQLKEDKDKLFISNSPFLNKADDNDLEFLKSETEYREFLKQILEKL
jgi:hypothetical protein